MLPTSTRGWFCWGVSVSERYEASHSPRYEYTGKTDPRADDRRESAISIKMLAEKASHRVSRNGAGLALMTQYFVEEMSWYAFSDREKWILDQTIRRFKRELIAAGFLPDDVRA